MEINPYQPPDENSADQKVPVEPIACPECGDLMEPGYVSTAGSLYWQNWLNPAWWHWVGLGLQRLAGTRPAFVGFNRLTGFRCRGCELIVFRYGAHKKAYAPQDRP